MLGCGYDCQILKSGLSAVMKQVIVYKDCQNVGEFLVIKQKHLKA